MNNMDLTTEVDQLFSKWDNNHSPGCALAVIQDGKIIYKRGYGMANLEHNIPISSDSVFRVGSVSKQFTAMCIALLAEQGKLSLDDNIRKYLPELPEYASNITINHLVHHTSGIRDYLTLFGLAGIPDEGLDFDPITETDVLNILSRQKQLNFNPGEKYTYSNSGYLLLAIIVQRVSGKTLAEFAKEYFFDPLGMKNTHYHNDHTMIVKNRVDGYEPKEEGGFKICMSNSNLTGDGAVFTTIEDLFKWDQNFYHNKVGVGGQELISQVLTTGTLNNGEEIDYAFGLSVSKYKGLTMVAHNGAFVGFRAVMIRFPEQQFSVICLANSREFPEMRLALQVAEIYLKNQLIQEPSEEQISEGRDEDEIVTLSEQDLEKFVGNYRYLETGTIWNVSIIEGNLTLRIYGVDKYSTTYSPIAKNKFKLMNDGPFAPFIEFKAVKNDPPNQLITTNARGDVSVCEAFEIISLSPEHLTEYAGSYFSEELDVSYNLYVENNILYFIFPSRKPENRPLYPTTKDEFTSRGVYFQFIRSENNEIKGFNLRTGRAAGIEFKKRVSS